MTTFESNDGETEAPGLPHKDYSEDVHTDTSTGAFEEHAKYVPPFKERREFLGSEEDPRLAVAAMARATRDAFLDACQVADGDEAESSFNLAKEKLFGLWDHASVKCHAFQDLVGLLDAAIRRLEFDSVPKSHRDSLRLAFSDLPKPFLEDAEVAAHVERFAEVGIDILGPIRETTGRKLRVHIEELE